jgi:hypothetical protein
VRVDQLPMPTLIRWGYRLSLILGCLMALMAIATALGWSDTSRLKDAPFGSWNVPVWVANALLAACFLIPIGLSLRAQKPNSRRLILALWLASFGCLGVEYLLARQESGAPVALGWLLSNVILSIPTLGISTWYLFSKRNVVAYFDALRSASPAA